MIAFLFVFFPMKLTIYVCKQKKEGGKNYLSLPLSSEFEDDDGGGGI